jgi:hypothetical protein
MQFTEYGKTLAKGETRFDPQGATGATAHMKACQHDAGIKVKLIGRDVNGKKFTMEAKSVEGAFMKARAAWGLNSAWHLREDGTRRLIFRR